MAIRHGKVIQHNLIWRSKSQTERRKQLLTDKNEQKTQADCIEKTEEKNGENAMCSNERMTTYTPLEQGRLKKN
ncbi:hypothetical protein GCM10008066_11980 [Oxalicibacterium faecigallinarum]|uniref:Uncharacterized protein n=2 Tax=Oxalicibacterium faecigallinarum TaxID=573741 RepID=A0A8J3F5M4_9BURK|nr:hypothetical protein GCM10008066_11980 [Oxalicibacterium faecigallinarum]